MTGLTRSAALVIAAIALACSPQKIEEVVRDAGASIDPYVPPIVTNPPQLPTLPLPKSASGAYELIEVAGSKLDLNPAQKDPITAVGRCADVVTACYRGGGSATLDSCIATARACTTAQPWNEKDACCPSACAAAFEAERQTGTAPLEAFEKVYFLEPGCFPGVMDAVGGAP